MKLTPFQLTRVQAILNYEISDNVKSVSNEEKCTLIVGYVGRLHMIELDHYLGDCGISVRPNDSETLKITIS